MIVSASRAILRTPKAWLSANSYVIDNRTKQLQGYRCYIGISGISKQSEPNGVFGVMGWNKKRKTVTPVWRQISTQSESNPENSRLDLVVEPESIASTNRGKQDNLAVSIMRGVADTSISSSSLLAKDEVDEAVGMVVSPGATCQNDGLVDARNVSRDAESACELQTISGIEYVDQTKVPKTKHAKSLEVGASVMRFIRGRDGSTQKSIEDMGVKIIFPSLKENDSIIIEGGSEDVITAASQKIEAIIDEVVKSPNLAYSHFISLPLAIHPELVEKVTRFQSTILGSDPSDVAGTTDENPGQDCAEGEDEVDPSDKEPKIAVKLITRDAPNQVNVDIKNIPTVSYAPKATKTPTLYDLRICKSLFLKPQRLHLTILMLKLWNKERVHAAMEVLQGVSSEVNEVLNNRPVFVTLKGLDILRGGSRSKAQVLYATVEEVGNEGRLLRACQIITDAYVKAGLVLERDARHKLKLHVTLMNTTFRRGRKGRTDSFDARGIFNQFGSEQWGDYHIREAHLSQRFVYDDNGFYHCCASIPFPGNSEVLEPGVSEVESEKLAVAGSA